MKVYILSDMEGASYVVRREALDGGATEIVVDDLHGARGGFNLVPEELHECAKYVTGGPRTCRMAGIDESFNIAFMIGYHAMAGTKGAVLDHTMATGIIVNAYINDLKVGEIGIDASIVGYFGVPAALITGCRRAVEEDLPGAIRKLGWF